MWADGLGWAQPLWQVESNVDGRVAGPLCAGMAV